MDSIKSWIQTQIPATRNFEFEVQTLKPSFIQLRIPLASHLNHKGTAFGGSLYNSAVIACYLLVHSELSSRGESSDSFVIADGSMKYLKPVTADFEVKVQWSNVELNNMLTSLHNKQKARWILQAQIECQNQICAEFQGRFVLQTKV